MPIHDGPVDFEKLTREELLSFLGWKMSVSAPAQQRHLPSSLDVWRAVNALEPLRAAIPHLATLLDYLGRDVTEHEGEQGYWDVCLICKAEVFRTATRHRDPLLCESCAPHTAHASLSLGDLPAAIVTSGPAHLLVLVQKGPTAALVGGFLHGIGKCLELNAEEGS